MRNSIFATQCLVATVLSLSGVWAQDAQVLPVLRGTIVTPPLVAQDFSLIDQTGASFKMSSTQGRVVILSFIYTHCGDTCPFVTLKLKKALSLLGPAARKVVLVAVTTDPLRDTLPVVARYSRQTGLYRSWHFVTGTPRDVKRVWDSYGVGVLFSNSSDTGQTGSGEATEAGDEHVQGLNRADRVLAKKIIKNFAGGYEVGHSAPFWIVDTKGMVRAVLDADALPEDLAADAKILLSQM